MKIIEKLPLFGGQLYRCNKTSSSSYSVCPTRPRDDDNEDRLWPSRRTNEVDGQARILSAVELLIARQLVKELQLCH